MTTEEKLDKLVAVTAELFNTIADIAEGGNYMARTRLEQIGPHLQELLKK